MLLCHQNMSLKVANGYSGCCSNLGGSKLNYGFDWNGDVKNKFFLDTEEESEPLPMATSAPAKPRKSYPPTFYLEVIKVARERFTHEISFQSKDKDISLAKALLYIAAEDDGFMAFKREMNACSLQNEWQGSSVESDVPEWDNIDAIPLAGKYISDWLGELDAIAKEVEAALVSRDIGCHLVEVLEAVNIVLFETHDFERSPILFDLKGSYLHSVLNSRSGSERYSKATIQCKIDELCKKSSQINTSSSD